MNWYYEYVDSIFDNKRITKQLKYRVDKADNYLDTCCIMHSIMTYKNDYLMENIEYDVYGDTTKTTYYYDNSGALENTTVLMYNGFEGVLINHPTKSDNKCFKILTVEFPNQTQPLTSSEIELFLSDYIMEFYDLECKPQELFLKSINDDISLSISRANCHSINTGSIKMTMNY